jgi:hypothetical protein
MIPSIKAVSGGLLVDWSDFITPNDFQLFEVWFGTISPPGRVWGQTQAKQVTLTGLASGTRYYIQIFAHDWFGPGTGSGIVDGVPA